jgi:hypothetical protein
VSRGFDVLPMRLPRALRRRAAEDARVREFVAVIRATAAEPAPAPQPATRPQPIAVVRVETPSGPVWQLDEASRARLPRRTDTAALPRIVARASAPLR